MANQDSDADYLEHNHLSLGIARHQREEGKYEIDEQIKEENPGISAFETSKSLIIIYRFLRQVGIPDEHELREPNVGPEDTEAEYELT